MSDSTIPSSDRQPVLDYTNWPRWSKYWHRSLALLDLWQYTDPESTVTLPPLTSTINRGINKSAVEQILKLCQYVSDECQPLIDGKTTPRDIWKALKAGCDRGTILPLTTQYERFHNNKWEPNDTISF
jgi:hypothetical protein